MRAQAPAKPAPSTSPQPLSAEDLAVVQSLDLLEALDLLKTWGADAALQLPEAEAEESEAK
jgi:hypothetical protein